MLTLRLKVENALIILRYLIKAVDRLTRKLVYVSFT